jgi:hypothetical protein
MDFDIQGGLGDNPGNNTPWTLWRRHLHKLAYYLQNPLSFSPTPLHSLEGWNTAQMGQCQDWVSRVQELYVGSDLELWRAGSALDKGKLVLREHLERQKLSVASLRGECKATNRR